MWVEAWKHDNAVEKLASLDLVKIKYERNLLCFFSANDRIII